jgi:hypothetical protein
MSGYGFSNALQNSNAGNSSSYNAGSSINYNAKKPSAAGAASNFHGNVGGGRGGMVENKNKKKSNAKSKEEVRLDKGGGKGEEGRAVEGGLAYTSSETTTASQLFKSFRRYF